MLKPFAPRVYATYDFMQNLFDICERDASLIRNLQQQADEQVKSQKTFALNWRLDATTFDTISFHGYEARHKPSDVSGLPRLYYDRSKPYTHTIRYFNNYVVTTTADKPVAYVIHRPGAR